MFGFKMKMFFSLVCALIFSATCLGNPVSGDEYFQKYITDMQSQIDTTIKPCDNFGKYACGNLKIDKIANDKVKLLKQNLPDYIPQNKAEKMVKTFYLSCVNSQDITKVLEQIDVLKSIKAWPVNRDFSEEEIAKLFGYLTTLEYTGLLDIEQSDLADDNTILIKLNYPYNDIDTIPTLLKKFGVSSEETVKTTEILTNFIRKLSKIRQLDYSNPTYDKFENVADFKKAVPNFDWNTYFNTFTDVFGLNKEEFVKKSVKIRNVEKLKKNLDLLKETDSKTVVNFLVWKYLTISEDIICERIFGFLFPLLSLRFLKSQSVEHAKFLLKELELFNHFEKSLSELKSQLNNPKTIKTMNDFINQKKTIAQNYEEMLHGQYLLELFRNFEINEETLYLNIVNVDHALNKLVVYNGKESDFQTLSKTLTSVAEKIIKMDAEPISVLHNFIVENTELWNKAISFDDIYKNQTISEKCFPYENKIENYRNMYYVKFHAAIHIAKHDYLNYVDENKDRFKKELEILTEAGLSNLKLYMLALAQQRCLDTETKSLEDDNLLWYLKHSKDFSESWGCSSEDAMNDICDDSSFVANLNKSL